MSQSDIDHWETAVNNDDVWSYRLGTSAPPEDWMMPDFDDSLWDVGQGGIGYGDGDDNTVIQPVHSLILRIDFELIDTSVIRMALLHADYDDAFVAYLNGTEIGRGNIGDPFETLDWNQNPPTDQEAVLYQGGIPEAFPIYPNTFEELVQEGQNTLAIQVNNFQITSSDLSSNFFLSLAITDESMNYGVVPDWFIEPVVGTHLPLLRITTSGEPIPDEPRIVANLQIVDNGPGEINYLGDQSTDYNGFIAVEQRGSSSLFYEKKNYGFETQDQDGENNNVSLLGMPPENDWILHGPYSDKSLLRNALTFEIGNDVMEYAPRTRFCELMMNGNYRGIYLLMEKIKRDNFRVDIANVLPEDTIGDELTGGYIIKMDRDDFNVEGDGWYSSFANYPFYAYHHPDYDQLNETQKTYIQEWMNSFELSMALPSYQSTYQDFIDVESFIDYFLINEVTKHIDAFKLSFYMYKEKNSNGGKLHMGPIWDFNLGYGNFDFECSPDPQGWIFPCTSNAFWLERLLEVEDIQDQTYCRWQQLRETSLSTEYLMTRIDSMVDLLGPAIDRNFQKFDVLGNYVWPNSFIGDTHEEEIEFLKDWLTDRLDWMDENIEANESVDCGVILSNEKVELKAEIKAYPNPFKDRITFSASSEQFLNGEVVIYDVMGSLIHRFSYSNQQSINLESLPSGIFIFEFRSENQLIQRGKLVKE